MKNVAEHAGVSPATVSRVLNGTAKVNPQTKNRVLAAIRELGYDELLTLRVRTVVSNNIITIVLHEIQKEFYHDLLYYLQYYIQETNYTLLFASTLDEKPNAADYIETVAQLSGGLILFSSDVSDVSMIRELQERDYPFVVIDNHFQDDMKVTSLLVDNHQASELVIQHLNSLGHTKIACLAGSPNLTVWVERVNGYIAAMRRRNLYINNDYIRYAFDDINGVEDAIYGFMSMEKPARPTAIYCFNDASAYLTITTLQNLGFQVPEDVSVVGIDAQPSLPAWYCGPALTSIRQPFDLLAKDSIGLLIDLIQKKATGGEVTPLQNYYLTTLEARESTAIVKDSNSPYFK